MTDRRLDEQAALDAVRGDLAALAAATPALPDAVMARLDAALAAEAHGPGAHSVPEAAPPPARVRSRWPRFLVAFATGIVVLAGIGVGVGALLRTNSSGDDPTAAQAPENSSGETPDQPDAAAPQKTGDKEGFGTDGLEPGDSTKEAPGTTLRSTGRHYTRDNLDTVTTFAIAEQDPAPELNRLADDSAALQSCFGAILASHPGILDLADFAYFEDDPALVVHVAERGGGERYVAVGADCGISGADELYTIAA